MIMTATNHDDQLGEIYPTMLNQLNCTFGVKFFTFSLLWPMAIMVCGRHGIGPFLSIFRKIKDPKQPTPLFNRYLLLKCPRTTRFCGLRIDTSIHFAMLLVFRAMLHFLDVLGY